MNEKPHFSGGDMVAMKASMQPPNQRMYQVHTRVLQCTISFWFHSMIWHVLRRFVVGTPGYDSLTVRKRTRQKLMLMTPNIKVKYRPSFCLRSSRRVRRSGNGRINTEMRLGFENRLAQELNGLTEYIRREVKSPCQNPHNILPERTAFCAL